MVSAFVPVHRIECNIYFIECTCTKVQYSIVSLYCYAPKSFGSFCWRVCACVLFRMRQADLLFLVLGYSKTINPRFAPSLGIPEGRGAKRSGLLVVFQKTVPKDGVKQ